MEDKIVIPDSMDRCLVDHFSSEIVGVRSIMNERMLERYGEFPIFPDPEVARSHEIVLPGREERICGRPEEGEEDFLWMYDAVTSRLKVTLPLSEFEVALFNRMNIAPSQLHPNSWAILRGFEMICDFLSIPLSQRVFFSLFMLVTFQGKDKKPAMVSLRAVVNRKCFATYEESYHGFKPRYFKIRAKAGNSPFFLSSEGAPLFPLYWQTSYCSPTYRARNLTSEEAAVVEFFTDTWGRLPDHVNLKRVIDVSSRDAKAYIEMSSNKTLALLRSLQRAPASTSAPSISKEDSEATHSGSSSPLAGKKRKAPEEPVRPASPIDLGAPEPEVNPPARSWGGFPSLSILAPNFRFKEFMSGICNSAFRRHVRQRDRKEVLSRVQEDLIKAAGYIGCYEEELEEVPLLKQQIHSLEVEKTGLQEMILNSEGKVSSLEKKVKSLETREKDLEKDLSVLRGEATELAESCKTLKSEKGKWESLVAESEAERAKVIKAWSDSSSDLFNNVMAQVRVLVGPEVDLSEVGIFRHVVDGRIEDIPEDDE